MFLTLSRERSTAFPSALPFNHHPVGKLHQWLASDRLYTRGKSSAEGEFRVSRSGIPALARASYRLKRKEAAPLVSPSIPSGHVLREETSKKRFFQ